MSFELKALQTLKSRIDEIIHDLRESIANGVSEDQYSHCLGMQEGLRTARGLIDDIATELIKGKD